MENLTNTISPLVIDIIFAVIILLVAALKAKAGLYQTVMSVAVIIIALAIGLVCSKMLTPTVKDYAWKKYSVTVADNFDSTVEAARSGEKSMSQAFQDSWNSIVKSFGSEKANAIFSIGQDDIDYSDEELVAKLKALTLMKSELLTERVVKVGLFGVITAIALFVLTIIKNILGKVAEFSIVGWANHLGGFVLGAVEAIVILIIVVRGANMLNIQIFNQLSEGTVLLKWLIGGDVQAAIQSLQNLTIEDVKNIKLEDLTTVDFDNLSDQVKELVNNVDVSDLTETSKDLVNEASELVNEVKNLQ